MRANRIISTAVLSLLLAVAAPAYAQQERHGEEQDHADQQGNREQAKPEQPHQQQEQQKQQQDHRNKQQKAEKQPRQNQNKQQQQAQQQMRQDRDKQQQRAQQSRGNQPPQRTPEQRRVQRTAWQRHGSQNWDSDHRTWQQRGGYHGYRIPDDRFRGYFGPSHGFRIYGLPFRVVRGYPRFQYQGYWFSPVDPWPAYWGNDWYDNDEVYVTYVDNGYYLFNRRYPNQGIAISISF
jgi:hypothetical protein